MKNARLVVAIIISVGLSACAGSSHTAGVRHSPSPIASPGPTVSAVAPATGTPEIEKVAPGSHCGIERWAVKTGTDATVKAVKPTPVQATIASLVALPQPPAAKTRTGAGNTRLAPVEDTTYSVSGIIKGYKIEADSDVHLVFVDTTGHTMIAEIPAASCVGASSPFKAQIAAVRAAWDKQHVASASGFTTVSLPVTITGVGFFDVLHGQRGVAPNGIELHPVLALTAR